MLLITRHELHKLLVNFIQPNTYYNFFTRESTIRRTITLLRGDMAQHKEEGYEHMYDFLSHEEMLQLIKAIQNTLTTCQISDMSVVDNQMLHSLMCEKLLNYMLDHQANNLNDRFLDVINEYFTKLNQELQLTSENSSQSSLNIWLSHLINYPALYINHMWVSGHGNTYGLRSLELEECGCMDLSHDRLLSDVRLKAESMVLERGKITNQLDSDQPFKLLSMGPGKGLQEFIIVWKLLQMGINKIELSLVEPEYGLLRETSKETRAIYCKNDSEDSPLPERYYLGHQDSIYSIIRAISLLSRCFSNADIKIFQYSSLSDLRKDKTINNSFDVAYAIDFDNYPDNCHNSKSEFHSMGDLLKPNGIAILSVHYQIQSFEVQQTIDQCALKEIELIKFDRILEKDGGYISKHAVDNYFKAYTN